MRFPAFRTMIVATTLVAASGLLAQTASAAGPVMGGVRAGYYFDAESPFVGGELLTRVDRSLYFNPNVEYVFVDNGSMMTLNGDFHYDLTRNSSTYAWLGAGLGILHRNPDGPFDSQTDLGANFLMGVGFGGGGAVPYLQVKGVASDQSEVSLAGGVRF